MIRSFVKLSNFLFLGLLFATCTKEESNLKEVLDPIEYSSLKGTIELFDKSANENKDYNDVHISITDSTQNSIDVTCNSEGQFEVDQLHIGDISILIEKPGYISVELKNITNTKNQDIIPTITLVEEIPFAYSLFDVDYNDGWLQYSNSVDIQTEKMYLAGEWYLIGSYLCFGKNRDININNNNLESGTGGYAGGKFFTDSGIKSMSFDKNMFLSNGFDRGDTIYVLNYAVNEKFSITNYELEQAYDIVSYKMNNPSPITFFILD